jgi:hypothetical protein
MSDSAPVAPRERCSRCGGTDSVKPLPARFACTRCGDRGLCYGCDVTHAQWCPVEAAEGGA